MDGESSRAGADPVNTRLTGSIPVAAKILREGGTVAFPTETVYGLGAMATCEAAVRRIFRAKGRPADNPLIVHVGDVNEVAAVAARIPRSAERLMEAFFPGPLSVILPRGPAIPLVVTAGLDTVAVRIPDHEVGRAFLQACGVPVAAPSANRSGRPSPTSWQAVKEDLDGRIDALLKGGNIRVGLESTVVDCTVSPPVVLRQGGVTVERLREVIPRLRAGQRCGDEGPARSPGLKYRHYAPRARVILIDDPAEISGAEARVSGYVGLTPPPARLRFLRTQVCRDVEEYAHHLFGFFRRCDAAGAVCVYGQRVGSQGLARALGDRLARAAEHPPSGR